MRERLKNYVYSPLLSLRSLCLLLVLSSLLLISGCSKGPLSLLTGGGPKVAANVQAGKTNNQTLGTNETFAPSVSVRPNAQVESIDQSSSKGTIVTEQIETVHNTNVSPLMLILLIVGWLAPSPSEIARGIRSLWPRKRH